MPSAPTHLAGLMDADPRRGAQQCLARGGAIAGIPAHGASAQMLPTASAMVACQQPIPHQPPNVSDEVANKAAEISVLRSRLQQFERENLKMKNEVAIAKDQSAQSDRARQSQADLERLQTELRYAKQDLISSEDERKRLKVSCDGVQAELKAVKSEQCRSAGASVATSQILQAMPPPAVAYSAAAPVPAAVQASSNGQLPSAPPFVSQAVGGLLSATAQSPYASASPQSPAQGQYASPVAPTQVPSRASSSRISAAPAKQWRQDVLLRELACWEAAFNAASRGQANHELAEPLPSWFALRESVSRLAHDRAAPNQQLSRSKAAATNNELAAAVTSQLRTACASQRWASVQGGARFVQVLVGLFPQVVSAPDSQSARAAKPSSAEKPSAVEFFDELIDSLHVLVLGPAGGEVEAHANVSDAGDRHACATQLLTTLFELVAKFRPHEIDALSSAFRRPSLCALLAEPPSADSFHLPCMKLLQGLLASAELYSLAHRAESHENPLLAVSNLLIIPTIEPGSGDRPGNDSADLQQCRVSALQLFCRCLASAPRIDMLLQLRAPTVNGETVETVLHRVVFLCHHELLCLGIHGLDGVLWHDTSLQECAKRRQSSIELALMILSSFVWHATPWTPEMQAAEHAATCSDACGALGRMRPLVASIVDMVFRRSARSAYYTRLLGSASALRVLLAHVDGEDTGMASGDNASRLGESERTATGAPINLE